MKFQLHFILLVTCLPAFVYSQSESRREGPILTSDSRSERLPPLYLDPRRRIETEDIYSGTPYERRSSRYFEDGFELERPSYRSSLRRRRPFPRISPLGRRYGRRLRRPSFLPRRRRLGPRSERRRPFYDPYFREFEPPRRDGRFRRRRRLRPRLRVSRPRGPRRRGPREYYPRDRGDEERPLEDARLERSRSPSRERRLEDESSLRRRRRRIIDRPRRIVPRERRPRGSPMRDRRVASGERPYADERPRTEYEGDSYADERLPYERLSDSISDRRSDRGLPRYDFGEEPRTMALYRPSRRRETDYRTTDYFDIHNSFDVLSPLNSSMSPIDDIYNSTTVDSSASFDNEITQQSPREKIFSFPRTHSIERLSSNSERTVTNLVESDLISQADGFLDKSNSSENGNQIAISKLDTFVSQPSNAKLSSITNDLTNKNADPDGLSKEVQLTITPEEIIDETLSQNRGNYTENIIPAVNSVIKQKLPKRTVGSSNTLSRKQPDFFKIPIPIPHPSIVVDLSRESKNRTAHNPLDVTTTGQVKVAVEMLNTQGSVRGKSNQEQDKFVTPKYTSQSVNNSVPAINEKFNVNAKTDKSIKPVIDTFSHKIPALEIHRRPKNMSKETPLSSLRESKSSDTIVSVKPISSILKSRDRKGLKVTEDTLIQTEEDPLPGREISQTQRRRPSSTKTLHRGDSLIPERDIANTDSLINDERVPVRRTTDGTLKTDASISESRLLPPDIPIQDDRSAPQSRRISSRRDYLDEIPISDREVLSQERFLRGDPLPLRRRFPGRRRYRDGLSVSEDSVLPSESPIRGERPILTRRRRPIRRLSRDERRMAEEDVLSSRRPYRDDRRTRRRRVSSPERYRDELPLTEDDFPSTDRLLGDDRPITRRSRLRSRSFGEEPSRIRAERRVESGIPSRRRRIPIRDSRDMSEIPRRRTRRLLRRDGGALESTERSHRDEMLMRRRRPPPPEERTREIPTEEVPVRRRRPPSSEERLREIPRVEIPVRRRRPPFPEERLGEIPRDEVPVRRRRPPTPEERLREIPRDEVPVRRRRPPSRPPSPEERLREIPRDEVREMPRKEILERSRRPTPPGERTREMPREALGRRRRLPPTEERLRDVSREDIIVRRRRPPPVEERPREVPRVEIPVRLRRLPPLEDRSRDFPAVDEPIRLRRLRTLEGRPRDILPVDEPLRRRRLPPSEERLRDVPRVEEPLRGRRLRSFEERSRGMPAEEEPRRLRRISRPEERLRDGARIRLPLLPERPRRREYVRSKPRLSLSDRPFRDSGRPRIEESFADEPVISRRRLRPRARPRARLEIDGSPFARIRQEERDSDTHDISTEGTTSTPAPVESITERLRLGAVRARGGEDGFPVHGGYCPGDRCADGGLAAGVQNGTGTGTLALFLERKRTGTNEDIAAYERDLRPRTTRTS